MPGGFICSFLKANTNKYNKMGVYRCRTLSSSNNSTNPNRECNVCVNVFLVYCTVCYGGYKGYGGFALGKDMSVPLHGGTSVVWINNVAVMPYIGATNCHQTSNNYSLSVCN